MARKHEEGHKPYSPVDEKLIRSLPSVFSSGDAAEQVEMVEEPKPGSNSVELSIVEEKKSGVSFEPLNKQLKFQVSGTEIREIRRIVGQLGAEFETSINWSHVGRALLLIFKQAEEELIKHARRSEPLTRPQNSDAIGLAEFEYEISKVLLRAIKGVKELT